ncbi:hypothetical protein KC356_g52 [Hortaea werneckii]|nr:hypothetical protein KC356_g52 [Hortaea werneckii]
MWPFQAGQRLLHVVSLLFSIRSFVAILSLTMKGIPCNGPLVQPVRRSSSSEAAICRQSGLTSITELMYILDDSSAGIHTARADEPCRVNGATRKAITKRKKYTFVVLCVSQADVNELRQWHRKIHWAVSTVHAYGRLSAEFSQPPPIHIMCFCVRSSLHRSWHGPVIWPFMATE